MLKKYASFAGIVLCVIMGFDHVAWAGDTTIGRYLTITNKPRHEQIYLLSQIIEVHFPSNIQTIGSAINYLLHLSGYSLVTPDKRNPALIITLNKPSPLIDHHFGPMTLKEGLTTLVGPAFYLIQDPVNRTVNFHLRLGFVKFSLHQQEAKSL